MSASVLPPFLTLIGGGGVNVSVAIGTGNEAGLLRIALDGLRVFKLGRSAKTEAVFLTLPADPGFKGEPTDWEPVAIMDPSQGGEIILKIPASYFGRPQATAFATTARAPAPQTGSLMSGSIARPHPGPSPAAERVRATLKDVENHKKGTK